MRALFDINVLIALLDEGHVFHERAHAWWAEHSGEGWASCPLVENGVVRIMSQPAYSAIRRFSVEELVAAVSSFVGNSNHQFWPDDISLRDPSCFAMDRLLSGRQLTDVYLLALASKKGGSLVTFDQSIPLPVVPIARPENLLVL